MVKKIMILEPLDVIKKSTHGASVTIVVGALLKKITKNII
jgi:hypothetical protein